MIERREKAGGGSCMVLLECPVCDEDLRGEKTSHHFETEHLPEDFGLSPLASGNGGAQRAD